MVLEMAHVVGTVATVSALVSADSNTSCFLKVIIEELVGINTSFVVEGRGRGRRNRMFCSGRLLHSCTAQETYLQYRKRWCHSNHNQLLLMQRKIGNYGKEILR